MVTRLSLVRVVATNHVFLVLRVLSDVPGQSAGDLVDGLTKAEEEVSFILNFTLNPQAKQMLANNDEVCSAQGCSYAHYFGHASHAAFEPGYR